MLTRMGPPPHACFTRAEGSEPDMSAFNDPDQFGSPAIPSGARSAPVDGSRPGEGAVPGMQPPPPVLPSRMGGLIPADTRPAKPVTAPTADGSRPAGLSGVRTSPATSGPLAGVKPPPDPNYSPDMRATQVPVQDAGTVEGNRVTSQANRAKTQDPFSPARLIHASRLP